MSRIAFEGFLMEEEKFLTEEGREKLEEEEEEEGAKAERFEVLGRRGIGMERRGEE